jgi:hypothetical protein
MTLFLLKSSMLKLRKRFCLSLLLLFILVFPKAGIKIDSVPLTLGYLSLGITSLFFFFRRPYRVLPPHFLALLLLAPFQLSVLTTWTCYGIENPSFALSFAVNLFILPWLFFGLFSSAIERLDHAYFIRFLKMGILFIAAYGILVFFARIITGKLFLIPFLAANLQDADTIEATKCIVRGDWLKLISTYQNGIIYGVSLLILLPLYIAVEESAIKRGIVKLSLILTLTRTVWIGLFLIQFIYPLFTQTLTLKILRKLALQLCLSALILIWVLRGINLDSWDFIFDANFGGRAILFEALDRWTLFGKPFSGIPEILYLGILDNFGLVGLITFSIGITAPLGIYLMQHTRDKTALAQGLFTYLFIACSDGALQFIPVMAFYWFTSAMLLSTRPYTSSNRTMSSSPTYSPT